ncbi:helix-turn-helix domain-containing protein [Edaphovirga cremea]|uniref:helix-turn-helix domain-containing protein n=1 Tax=Edaphovirga cremea TaxID=2267246 RepID=UPI0039898DEA
MNTHQKSTLSGMNKLHARQVFNARQRISVNLKRLRKERNLSQEKLAELAEFHRTYISQLERCVTNISIDGIEKLATALEVDVIELISPVK